VNLKPTNYKVKENEINVFMSITNSGLSTCEKGHEFTINESSFTGKLLKDQSSKLVKKLGDKKFSLNKRVAARKTETVQLDFSKEDVDAINKGDKVNLEVQFMQFSSAAHDDPTALKLSFLA
jgi:hypothetical protein